MITEKSVREAIEVLKMHMKCHCGCLDTAIAVMENHLKARKIASDSFDDHMKHLKMISEYRAERMFNGKKKARKKCKTK